MKKLLIGTMLLSSFGAFANTSTTSTDSSISEDKNFSISLRKDLSINFENIKDNSKETISGTTIAGAYTDRINSWFMYEVGTSLSLIVAENEYGYGYFANSKIESNIYANIVDRLSVFGGLNISKLHQPIDAETNAGLGFQAGLQASISESFKADLRYWKTNSTISKSKKEFTLSSLALGISYVF